MSLRLWRRKTLFPGLRLNLSRSGVSLSVGRPGMWATVGRRGRTVTIGAPGTGLRWTEHYYGRPKPTKATGGPPMAAGSTAPPLGDARIGQAILVGLSILAGGVIVIAFAAIIAAAN